MKLSEMDTMQLAACMCAIARPIERIGKNKAVHEMLGGYKNDPGAPLLARYAGLVGVLVPALLGECIEETVEIVSAMTGKGVEAVKKQKGLQTVADILGFVDADFIDFFGSSAGTKRDE